MSFGTALGFTHYLVNLMSIGTIPSKIDQYLDLLHRLCCLVHTLTMTGMGDYTLGWSGFYHFLKTHGLTPYLMCFLMLITISSSKFTVSKKGAPSAFAVK